MKMTEMIARIVKAANDSYVVAMGQMFTNNMLEGALGMTKGSLGNRQPRGDALKEAVAGGMDPKFLGKDSPIDKRSLYKIRGKLNQARMRDGDPLDIVMRMAEGNWAFKLGVSKSSDIKSGKFGFKNFSNLFSYKMSQEVLSYIKIQNRRPEQYLNDPYGGDGTQEVDERGMDQFEDTEPSGPDGWADSVSELLGGLMEQRGRDGDKVRNWFDMQIRNLRPESVQKAAVAVLEWMKKNPGRSLNTTAVGRELGVSRQSIHKFWTKAIDQLNQKAKNDSKLKEILKDNSHMLRAAAIRAKMARIERTASGVQGVIELCFTLGGGRVASADPSTDPRVHLADSPETLEWILNKSASIIQDAVDVEISE